MGRFCWRLAVVLCVLGPAAGRAQDLTVYDDALQNSFQDWSYAPVAANISFASTAAVHTGTYAISFDQANYSSAISFAHPSVALSTAQYPALHFWVNGGAAGGQKLQVDLQLGGTLVASGALDGYVAGGGLAAGSWREATVTFAQAPISYSGSFDRIDVQGAQASAQPVLYVDDIALLAPAAPPPAGAMLIERGVTVATMPSDRFTWQDSSGQPRVAVLAHNDATGSHGEHGGALREFRYELPGGGGTRVCDVTTYNNGAYGGFGYVVSHRGDGTTGIAADDSPLGFGFTGTWQRVFEGRHHAIFQFTQLYPRYSSTSASPPNTLYWVPVTVQWMMSTGRDNPLWAVTWDLSGVPADALEDDSRAPYGELNIDGTGAVDISGVAWGDRYRFFSKTVPVTLDSDWDWTAANTVPYVKLWIASTDATMGTVQTQTLEQHDAGAGRNAFWHDLRPYWTQTWTTAGNAGGGYKMPWQDSWPFQANAFSLGPGAGGSNNNARLTWGTMYGFLGQQSYATNNGLTATASGWPRQSYSTYVVLGLHSTGPVEAQVAQVEAVKDVALSAATGSVAIGGPAGAGRSDTIVYAPAGYDPVYGAFTFVASGNALDGNVGVAAGTLHHPLLVVRGYTSASYPVVKLAGATLVQDADYFPSLRGGASELWITLNRDLAGAVNHLEISAPGGAPAGLFLHLLTPCRVYDTRSTGGVDAGSPALVAGATRTFATEGRCGIPAGAKALAANVTITGAAAAGYVTVYPADAGGAPLASTINFVPGRTRANNAVLKTATDGSAGIAVLNGSGGSADFILDVSGWFE